jgi:hypothetical protein
MLIDRSRESTLFKRLTMWNIFRPGLCCIKSRNTSIVCYILWGVIRIICMDLNGSGCGPVIGSYEHSNKPLDTRKCREFLEHLSYY